MTGSSQLSLIQGVFIEGVSIHYCLLREQISCAMLIYRPSSNLPQTRLFIIFSLPQYFPHKIPLQIKSLCVDRLPSIQDSLHHIVRFLQPLPFAKELDMYVWRHDTVVSFQIIC